MKVYNSWESLFWSIVAKESLRVLQQEKSQTHDTNDNSNDNNNKTRFLCDVQRRITYFLLFSIISSQTTWKETYFIFHKKSSVCNIRSQLQSQSWEGVFHSRIDDADRIANCQDKNMAWIPPCANNKKNKWPKTENPT